MSLEEVGLQMFPEDGGLLQTVRSEVIGVQHMNRMNTALTLSSAPRLE